jgi:hypothetical protein
MTGKPYESPFYLAAGRYGIRLFIVAIFFRFSVMEPIYLCENKSHLSGLNTLTHRLN